MANWYVRATAPGTANGADWADAYLTLAAAASATNTAVGDTIWVSEDHVELTTTNTVISFPYALATPTYVLCANHLVATPNVAVDLQTTANISSNAYLIINNFVGVIYGLNFNSGLGNTTGVAPIQITGNGYLYPKFLNCNFSHGGASSTSQFSLGKSGGSYLYFNNCNFVFAGTGQRFIPGGSFVEFYNCKFCKTGAIVTNLFLNTAGQGSTGSMKMVDCDLSSVNTIIFQSTNNNFGSYYVTMENCLLNTAVTVLGSTAALTSNVTILRSNFSYEGTNYNTYGNAIGSNTTYRNGGGKFDTIPFSKNITTSPNTNTQFPFTALTASRFVATVGSPLKAFIYGTWNGAAPPDNSQVWVHLEYLGTAANTLLSVASSGIGNANTNQQFLPGMAATAGSVDSVSTWTLGGTNNFFISVPFTPQQEGYVTAKVRVGVTSLAAANLYIDPVVYITDNANNPLTTTSLTYNTALGITNEDGTATQNSSIIIQGL